MANDGFDEEATKGEKPGPGYPERMNRHAEVQPTTSPRLPGHAPPVWPRPASLAPPLLSDRQGARPTSQLPRAARACPVWAQPRLSERRGGAGSRARSRRAEPRWASARTGAAAVGWRGRCRPRRAVGSNRLQVGGWAAGPTEGCQAGASSEVLEGAAARTPAPEGPGTGRAARAGRAAARGAQAVSPQVRRGYL